MSLTVEAAGQTHLGKVRNRNEDAYYLGEWLYAVADGLGGHVAGDIASATAINVLKSHDHPVPPGDLAKVLGGAVSDAHETLRRRIRREPALTGMGTTMVALLRSGDAAVLANIGDSRAYRMRNFRVNRRPLTQISEDHTYQHLVAKASEVPNLPEKLSRFLDGRNEGRSADLIPLHLIPGDRILLCSDGLSSYVPHELIRTRMAAGNTPAQVANDLVASALDHGGKDNVTVLIMDVNGRQDADELAVPLANMDEVQRR